MREFSTAASRNASGFRNAEPIEFKLDDNVLTARPPTTGQVGLLVQGQRGGGVRSVTTLFEFFSDILGDDDWKIVHEKLRDGMDVDLLNDIATYLIGEWSGRPTTSPSASSVTRNGTGQRSTVKRPAKAAPTTSRSRSTGS